MKKNDDHLKENIQRLLEKHKLSMKGLERKAGLKEKAVQNILAGYSKQPQIGTLRSIAETLGCTVSQLLGEDKLKGELFKDLGLLREVFSSLIEELEKTTVHVTSKDFSYLLEAAYLDSQVNGEVDVDYIKLLLKRFLKGKKQISPESKDEKDC